MEPSAQNIHDLRQKFLQKVDEDRKDFHHKDLQRVRHDDSWLRRFLMHHDLSIKDALDMLISTCEWRQANAVNDINEHTINMEYLKEGSVFAHGKDKDGMSLLIFKCKKHVKGQKDLDELKKVVIYWFERIERLEANQQMTLFFDMANTGLPNVDMEYTKYLINLCKLYYPYFLNYILIFEIPWALNAAFKIIKSWLPAKAVEKIKFVNKVSVKDFVDVDQCLISWGGTDPYEFTLESMELLKSDENRKKVHFADIDWNSNDSPRDSGGYGLPNLSSPLSDGNYSGGKVKISPSDTISFANDGLEMIGRFTVTNISDGIIAYKVKTTSPEKFRVKPSQGLIEKSECVVIAVTALGGYSAVSIMRDKFQIKAISIDNVNEVATNDLNELWKSSDMTKVEQIRLKCTVACTNGVPSPGFFSPGMTAAGDGSSHTDTGTVLLAVNQVHKKVESLEGQVFQINVLMISNVLLLLIFIGYYIYTNEFWDEETFTQG